MAGILRYQQRALGGYAKTHILRNNFSGHAQTDYDLSEIEFHTEKAFMFATPSPRDGPSGMIRIYPLYEIPYRYVDANITLFYRLLFERDTQDEDEKEYGRQWNNCFQIANRLRKQGILYNSHAIEEFLEQFDNCEERETMILDFMDCCLVMAWIAPLIALSRHMQKYYTDCPTAFYSLSQFSPLSIRVVVLSNIRFMFEKEQKIETEYCNSYYLLLLLLQDKYISHKSKKPIIEEITTKSILGSHKWVNPCLM